MGIGFPTCGCPPTIEGDQLNSPVADGDTCITIFYIVNSDFSYAKIAVKVQPSATITIINNRFHVMIKPGKKKKAQC